MSRHIKNVSPKMLKKFLSKIGCEYKRTSGGHEHWNKKGLMRPITFQTHINPIPEFIVKQILKNLQVSADEFWAILEDEENKKQ